MTTQNEPDIIARLDQLEQSLENMGKLLSGYYKSLREGGIPKPLAFQLVMDYQNFMLSQSMNQSE